MPGQHEREDLNPVRRFWRPLALPGAHSCSCFSEVPCGSRTRLTSLEDWGLAARPRAQFVCGRQRCGWPSRLRRKESNLHPLINSQVDCLYRDTGVGRIERRDRRGRTRTFNLVLIRGRLSPLSYAPGEQPWRRSARKSPAATPGRQVHPVCSASALPRSARAPSPGLAILIRDASYAGHGRSGWFRCSRCLGRRAPLDTQQTVDPG